MNKYGYQALSQLASMKYPPERKLSKLTEKFHFLVRTIKHNICTVTDIMLDNGIHRNDKQLN